ncbi:MAG: SurA N-terminal domain-containing protein [Nitrospirae bacterium]|nr:SurA N-terminal domain-containing protein [Nitrospirota bacterium]MCL5062675.1 SurA N-terminal domain-containing protein [Nitrospirota bacterium]MDA8215528.1 SurA N-terminal domain-containing protein [Nitrospiraceae bacterium]MDA8337779.1 SurA N-terminal domain-containing protein [Nitrospiraceae bacterium]
MLKTMRKHAKFFYFLFFIVILSFIFWGVGTLDKPTAVSVAEIGKERVTVEEYWRAYENVRQQFRDIYKEKFDAEMEKSLKLKETVLNSLIEERVLLISAAELGIKVTDKELQDAIVNDPRFMRDGIFRKDVYFRTLDLNRLTPEMFENSMRQQLTLLKMRRLIASAVDVNPLDLRGVSGDEKKINEAKQAILADKGNAAIKSYVDGVKQRMKFKVNMDLIS